MRKNLITRLMQTRWKYLIGIIIAALLVWLLLEPTGDEARIAGLSEALEQGKIGRLTPAEEKQFDTEINTLCHIADVTQPVEINHISGNLKDFNSKLHVFITTVAALPFTHCTKGNAVFDAQVNCVFIDLSLFRLNDWMIYQEGIQLNNGDLPFLATYRRFIVLHELGHYKLHKTSGGFFDLRNDGVNKQSRKKEMQADSFAISHWGQYLNLQPKDDNIGESMNFGDFKRTDANNTAVSLIEMGNNITLGMTYGLSPYSPFFNDAAHPTYFDRVKSLINTIISKEGIDSKVRARAALTFALLNRTQQVAHENEIAEIATSGPLLDIGFSEDGLVILPYAKGLYYTVPFDNVEKLKKLGQIESYEVPNNYRHQTPPLIDSNAKETLFSLEGSGTFCDSDNKLFRLGDNGFSDISNTSFGKIFAGATNLYVPSQPGNKAVVVGDSIFYVISSANKILQKKISEIENEIKQQSKLTGKPNFFGTLINEDVAAVPLENDSTFNKLTGIAVINLKNLKVSLISDFMIPDHFFNNGALGRTGYDDSENQYLYSIDPINAMVIRLIKENQVSVSWQLFSASGSNAGQLVKNIPFISTEVSDRKSIGDFSPEMYHQGITPVGKNLFLLNWNGDSIFLVNTLDHSVKPVFNPGDETIKIRVSKQGYVAIFTPGVKKFYLLKLNKS